MSPMPSWLLSQKLRGVNLVDDTFLPPGFFHRLIRSFACVYKTGQPFTAPSVMPVITCFCSSRNRTTTGNGDEHRREDQLPGVAILAHDLLGVIKLSGVRVLFSALPITR